MVTPTLYPRILYTRTVNSDFIMAEAAQLDAFLAAMTQYSPTVPEELVEFYLHQGGFVTNDVRMCVIPTHNVVLINKTLPN